TLDAPPSHYFFFMATTEKHKIIPTILSRCQIYDFNRIRVEDAVEYLKYIASSEGITADEESLNLIAQKADGGMRDALSMFDKAVSFCGTTLDYRNVAQTLNVLDYDTYFGITEMLLAGDYVQALVSFDEVLAKGFSGQTFMSGLNRHLRDLLMAARPETLRLIEMTGTLLERYRTQAGACEVGFLFGAIAVLTELDGKIRQSSNQRLLVELGLMKIARLGQKKNDPLTYAEEEYPLPDLTPASRPSPAAAPASSVQSASSAPAPEPTPQEKSAPAAAAAATSGDSVGADSAVAPAPDETPEQEAETLRALQPAQEAPKPAATKPAAETPAARSSRKPLISGTSLADLLAGSGSGAEESDEGEPEERMEDADFDPACGEKLERARGKILELIKARRPRFVPAFELMTFRDNVIAVSVPTAELREEILRNKTAMLLRIVELAGIEGAIDLEVTVDERIRAARPIKPEDKMKFLTEKNPAVTELRKALDLEME
ncbi:MAG: DNA polymerase III subunit gamma/tau, partial [Alistipes sp.]|nr:DNA polymerase III subunit gamma/tau [Alistipes sp.]